MGFLQKHHKVPIFYAGVFFVCFFLCMPAVFAQNESTDSIPSDTVPVTYPVVKGKGGFENDTVRAVVKPEVAPAQAPETKKNKPPQEPKLKAEKDTLRPHSPKMAMGMSAILPGLGQVYNRKYWKVPVVYVGLGVCTYLIWTETAQFRKYKETYRMRVTNDSTSTDWFPNETLNTVSEMKEYHHRNIELSYIAAGLIYLLNIVDATVDAHLYDFNVTDDLSMRIEPSMIRMGGSAGNIRATGLSLTLKF